MIKINFWFLYILITRYRNKFMENCSSEHSIVPSNVSLMELVKKYGAPLKITFLDNIKEKVVNLKKTFDKAIKQNQYNGKFFTVNANKANYESVGIETAIKAGDGVECSSYYDLLLTKDILLKLGLKNKSLLLCNGYKTLDYVNEIIASKNEGWDIIPIIDCEEEFLSYKNAKLSSPMNVGIRVHLCSQYPEEGNPITDDRFGVLESEFDFIINELKNCKNLVLTTIHFHQRGFEFEEDKYIINLQKSFLNYYVKASKIFKSLNYFDMGGGTPLPESNDFDYDYWANLTIKTIKNMCDKENIAHPNLISENGKYNRKNSVVNIYEVIKVKYTDPIYPWYIVDGCLLIAMPEYYALGEPMKIVPINHLDKKFIKARLCGISCDCDDVFYEKDKGYIALPKLENNEHLYIAIMGTGSYQDSMNGKGGIHHCLIPEEKDLIIYTNEKGEVIEKLQSGLQSIEQIKRLVHLN